MSTQETPNYEMVVIAFEDEYKADEVLNALKQMDPANAPELDAWANRILAARDASLGAGIEGMRPQHVVVGDTWTQVDSVLESSDDGDEMHGYYEWTPDIELQSVSGTTGDAQNTVNGSGLNANDEHSTRAEDMWLAMGNGVDPVWIQFEFDRVYKLHQALVWNYNVEFEPVLGFGLHLFAFAEGGGILRRTRAGNWERA